MNSISNQDAEIAVLNVILNNPDMVYNVPDIKPFMFSTSSHQQIYSVIADIISSNSIPEYNLVLATLSNKSKLNEVGGVEYLNYIRSLAISKDNIKEYARQLRESYKTKSILQLASGISTQLNSGQDVNSLISDLKNNIDRLEDTSGGEQIVDMLTATTDMWNSLVYRIENPGLRGITTGFSSLDSITGGYNEGDLFIVAGRPSMGKTAQMCNSALGVAEYIKSHETGQSVQIFSLEMNRTSLVERMVAMKSGVPLADIRLGSLSQVQLNKVTETIKYLKGLPIYIDTNFDTNDVYYGATVRKYHKLRNVRVTFFDYVQLASERNADQTAEIGRFTRMAKLLANDLGITSVVYSQLNRSVELREDKRPVLSDLRQSGNIEEDADTVIFLYRDDYYNPNTTSKGELEFILRKQRNGPTGSIFNLFNSETLSISPK
jgi:replicative DNA helicase